MLRVMDDGQTAEDRVAELVSAQPPRRGHDPSHPECGANFLDMARGARTGPHDLLERDDIRVDVPQHGGRSIGTRASIHAAAAMDVVGDDAQRRRLAGTHWAIIAAGCANGGEWSGRRGPTQRAPGYRGRVPGGDGGRVERALGPA